MSKVIEKEKLIEEIRKDINILQDENIRKMILSYECKNEFEFLLYHFNCFDYFKDSDFIDLLLQCDDSVNKVIKIISLDNIEKSKFLKQDKIIALIFDNMDYFKYLLNNDSLDISFAQKYFDYLVEYDIDLLCYLPQKLQIKLLLNNENILKIEKLNDLLRKLNVNVLENVLNNKIILNSFVSLHPKDIYEFIYQGLKLPKSIYCNNEFINKYLDNYNIYEYRCVMDNLYVNNSFIAEKIEKLRVKLYLNEINNIDSNKLTLYYQKVFSLLGNPEKLRKFLSDTSNNELLLENDKLLHSNNPLLFLQRLSLKQELDIIMDCGFNDVSKDTIEVISNMVYYNSCLAESVLSEDRLNIYNKILKYNKLSKIEKKHLLLSLFPIYENQVKYYDDYKMLQKKCYSDLTSDLFYPNINNINKEMSLEYSLPVYLLDGQDFNMMVNCTFQLKRKNISISYGEVSTTSFSYINQDYMLTIRDYTEKVVLGFNKLDINKIVHLYNKDSFSTYDKGSEYISKLYTPEGLIAETKNYNEILYLNKDNIQANKIEMIKPDYIVCFDSIGKGDIELANQYNIPVVFIDTNKYKKNKILNKVMYLNEGEYYRLSDVPIR